MSELGLQSPRARSGLPPEVTRRTATARFSPRGEDASLEGRLRRTFVLIGAMVSVAFVATALAFL